MTAGVSTSFWSGWVTVITAVSVLGLLWFVISVYFSRGSAGTHGPNEIWDETLTEGTAPAPLWWFWFIVALLAATVVYLILYPGMGSHRGVFEWTQGGQIAESRARFDASFGPDRERVTQTSVTDLQLEATALRAGWHLFNNHCAACHGPEARGQAKLFPNLSNDRWQWGGSERDITQTITVGRLAVMPPWQAALGDEGVAAVAEYVRALASGKAPADGRGAEIYRTNCIACHQADGAGLAALGAPPLNDAEWLYGASLDDIRATISLGRSGQMPAFGERLDATQIKLLTAWLISGAEPMRGVSAAD
jgi:cytochrome c oxidase cbb3-type subunit 3